MYRVKHLKRSIDACFFLMIRRPTRSTQGVTSAASDVYKRQRLLEALALHDDLPTAVVDYLDDELEFLG
ncbi:hypothetical protein AMBR_JPGBJEAN_02785 [Lacticaseibacillus rhamnosus]|nr:hypothetical protein AMBR_JPGBJEAN_02785 [Lacticaseibacillus rhamnosus]